MQKRKQLKDKEPYKKVWVWDDLTPLRSKLLAYCRELEQVEWVSTTHDGRLRCQMKEPSGRSRRDGEVGTVIFVETPDDLFKLGVDTVDFSRFGLGHFVHESIGQD